jgi:hypothetical protein
MGKARKMEIWAILFTSAFVCTGTANAGPILTWLGLGNDPPPSYSPAHFWAPGATKLYADIHGPRINVYPPDRHPEISPTHTILQYPTSIALPAETIIKRPTPPVTSPAQ